MNDDIVDECAYTRDDRARGIVVESKSIVQDGPGPSKAAEQDREIEPALPVVDMRSNREICSQKCGVWHLKRAVWRWAGSNRVGDVETRRLPPEEHVGGLNGGISFEASILGAVR